jgi:VanZ family protein
MKKWQGQLFFFGLAVLWGCLIFYLSGIPNLASGLPHRYDFVLRKLAHITVFAILAYLTAGSFSSQRKPYLLIVIVAVVSYALIDELHQASVPTRSGNARDVLIDSLGVYFGLWFYKIKSPAKFLGIK